jgi:hypothetical protein
LVQFGPPLALHLAVGASLVGTALGALRQRERSGAGRLVGVLGAAGVLAPWVYLLAVRPWLVHWGATDDELRRALPGDDLIPHPIYEVTRAITIQAPVAAVWPWVVQIGQGRGGFYSYDWLENLGGLEIHSADHIVPGLQELAVGDTVPFSPDGSGMTVAVIEPERALVLAVTVDLWTQAAVPAGGPRPGTYLESTWAFALERRDEHTTRLIVRGRSDGNPRRWLGLFAALLLELPESVMQRRQLLGIKQRAEEAHFGA